MAKGVIAQSIKLKEQVINETMLSKGEIKKIVRIVSQDRITEKVKDSIADLIYDRTHNPLSFDKTHKRKSTQFINSEEHGETIDDWWAHDGDKKSWELTNIEYFLYEFALIGTIDGFGGVLTSLESSRHWHSIRFDSSNFKRNDFLTQMKALNKEFNKTKRTLLTIDITVFVIDSAHLSEFKKIVKRTKWGNVIQY
ncbi:MAG: hypothetical protein J7577_06005 [Sphingobacteriaceae bacterium]|nr:hypothetical protein [Sphingobacteriaceae bacterium]